MQMPYNGGRVHITTQVGLPRIIQHAFSSPSGQYSLLAAFETTLWDYSQVVYVSAQHIAVRTYAQNHVRLFPN